MANDTLPSIDTLDLDAVTGGITATSSSSTDLTAMIQQITTAIAGLGQNQSNNGSNSLQAMLPMLLMSRGGGGGSGGACPCGCGMANCMPR